MIESRSSVLYKTWMDVNHSPAAEDSRISYISYINPRQEFVLRVVDENGFLISNDELIVERNNVGRYLEHVTRNVAASLRKYQAFVDWLLHLHLGGFSYVTVMEILAGINCENAESFETSEENAERTRNAERTKGKNNRVRHNRNCIESYSDFFARFNIDEDELIEYGFSKSIFASADAALNRWHNLREDLLSDRPVYIRADPRGIWREFYRQVFNNSHVLTDPDGNTEPIAVMSRMTNHTTRPASFPECIVLENYILSHVFDFRTMNPLLFSNPCNFAFTPSFIDPFTGKAAGNFAVRYRRAFRQYAFEKYNQVYIEYKTFVNEHNIMRQIDEFVFYPATPQQMRNFKRNARKNWSVEFIDE